MASYDEILGQVPLKELAGQLGVDESEVEQAARTALPALLGGLQANAHDPAGAQSLASALSDHQGRSVGSLADVDEQDGQRIVGNIFGDNTDQVMSQLGGVGSGIGGSGAAGSLVQKLLPILAPIVMSWLANKIGQGGGLGSILGGGSGAADDVTARAPTAARSSRAARAPAADRCSRPAGRPRRRVAPTRSRTSSVRSSAAAPAGPADRRSAAPATSWAASSEDCWAAASAEPAGPSGAISRVGTRPGQV